jgi:ribosomal protein S18 acetylase RimI-like enzyme
MIIRKATKADAEYIASYMLLAMEEIVYHFIGEKDGRKAKALMWYFAEREDNQYSYQNCWVAVLDQEVVAAVNIYDGARLQELRQPFVEHIKARFNKDFQPQAETGAGEYYIDTLGVHPVHQGKGIGSKMLQFLIEEYVIKQKQTLGLLVEKENTKAKRLYSKLGFKSSGTKVLWGKELEHLQIKGKDPYFDYH